jgi:hypothetical protein
MSIASSSVSFDQAPTKYSVPFRMFVGGKDGWNDLAVPQGENRDCWLLQDVLLTVKVRALM